MKKEPIVILKPKARLPQIVDDTKSVDVKFWHSQPKPKKNISKEVVDRRTVYENGNFWGRVL